ncbi:MAG TPA: MBG domain-containing protein [Anaerolineales bacterium]|nr:MBG domain-containing protein [Anaerolineales bacterium]
MNRLRIFLRGSLAIIVLLLVTIFPLSTALADSVGPNNPGLGSNVDYINGTESWSLPEEISSPGSPYASVTLYQGHRNSEYLMGNEYGFSIPLNAPINGIEVMINRMSSAHNPSAEDTEVRLVKGGTIVGDNKAVIDTSWPITFTMATYGGPTDLWGSTWTAADINSVDFGVVLAVDRDNNGNNARDALVDSMQITVYYGYSSTAAVECGNGTPIVYGENLTCVVTITANLADRTPSGTVGWTSDSSGAFTPNPCNLVGANGIASCSTTYTPGEVGDSTHLLTATYNGDSYFTGSSDSETIGVVVRPVTVTANPQTKVYGEVDPPLTYLITEGSLVFNDTFTGTLVRNPGEDAGSYAIFQGSLALSTNYDLTYLGDYLTILKANPDCEVFEYDVTYDGNEHIATGTCTGAFGEDLDGLDLSGTAHTNVGVYENDPWIYTDVTGNYNDASDTVNDVIRKISITVAADEKSKLFMQPDPELTYQVTNGDLLPGDLFTGHLTREPGEMPGTYPILQGTLTLPDYYEITFESAAFTIISSGLFLPLVYR